MFNEIFLAFLEEAKLSKELLALGVTQLYKANYANKGIYFQSFTCLYSGFERLEKLCLILNYYIKSNGCLPNENDIRKYGHNINALFEKCRQIENEHNLRVNFKCKLDDEIHTSILEVLNDFAKSSGRYSNMNTLINAPKTDIDCLENWYNNVDLKIYSVNVTLAKKQKIENNAKAIGSILNQFGLAIFSTEDNLVITDHEELSRRTGIWEAIAKYRQLYTLQIIRYLSEIIIELGHKAMIINNQDIPYFSEIFGLFYNDDSYFKTRKTWDKLQ